MIGLGHLQRCLSLAVVLNTHHIDSLFLVNQSSNSFERIASRGFTSNALVATESWMADDAAETLEFASQQRCNAIVVDSHDVGIDYLTSLQERGCLIIVRDDLAENSFPCQMLFNGNADALRLPYKLYSDDTKFLLGPEYIVLPPEFDGLADPARPTVDTVKTALVTLGGTDGYNLMPRLINLMDELPGNFSITAVVGPFFSNIKAVQNAAETARRRVRLVQAPKSLHELMSEADLAVSAAGQTLYELAYMGCPTVALSVASNQRGQLEALAEAGVVSTAGDAEEDNLLESVGGALLPLLSNAQSRAAMTTAAQAMVDGNGGKRVASEISAQISELPNRQL